MTDFDTMISFVSKLAETVQAAKTTSEELEVARTALAEATTYVDRVIGQRDEWRQLQADTKAHLDQTTQERDEARAQAREVSEALAAANAKLDTFRAMLGVDSRTTPSTPQPTEQPIADPHPATPQEHLDLAPAGGTGGVEQTHVAAVAPDNWRHSDSPFEHPEKNEPTPAPEVAEPRPTPPQTGDSSAPSSGPTDDPRFGNAVETDPERGGPVSWRDSASHVAYRPFSF